MRSADTDGHEAVPAVGIDVEGIGGNDLEVGLKIKKFYEIRKFLNPEKSLPAYVKAEIKTETWEDRSNAKHVSLNGSLSIADCSRTIHLDFYGEDARARKRVLRKAKFLQKVMNDFVNALENAAVYVESENAKKNDKKPVRKV